MKNDLIYFSENYTNSLITAQGELDLLNNLYFLFILIFLKLY